MVVVFNAYVEDDGLIMFEVSDAPHPCFSFSSHTMVPWTKLRANDERDNLVVRAGVHLVSKRRLGGRFQVEHSIFKEDLSRLRHPLSVETNHKSCPCPQDLLLDLPGSIFISEDFIYLGI